MLRSAPHKPGRWTRGHTDTGSAWEGDTIYPVPRPEGVPLTCPQNPFRMGTMGEWYRQRRRSLRNMVWSEARAGSGREPTPLGPEGSRAGPSHHVVTAELFRSPAAANPSISVVTRVTSHRVGRQHARRTTPGESSSTRYLTAWSVAAAAELASFAVLVKPRTSSPNTPAERSQLARRTRRGRSRGATVKPQPRLDGASTIEPGNRQGRKSSGDDLPR